MSAIAKAHFEFELSTNAVTWTSYAVDAIKVTPSGNERMWGEAYTAGQDGPHVTTGKKNASEVTFGVLYEEGATDLYRVLQGYFENNTAFYFRYTPTGNLTSPSRYVTYGPGFLRALPDPEGDAASGEPMNIEGVFVSGTRAIGAHS